VAPRRTLAGRIVALGLAQLLAVRSVGYVLASLADH
jgi:hypothetical protein